MSENLGHLNEPSTDGWERVVVSASSPPRRTIRPGSPAGFRRVGGAAQLARRRRVRWKVRELG